MTTNNDVPDRSLLWAVIQTITSLREGPLFESARHFTRQCLGHQEALVIEKAVLDHLAPFFAPERTIRRVDLVDVLLVDRPQSLDPYAHVELHVVSEPDDVVWDVYVAIDSIPWFFIPTWEST